MSSRKQIPNMIYDIIVQEHAHALQEDSAESVDSSRLRMTELVRTSDDVRDVKMLSLRIFDSLQVVLEFMDKGVKGLLTGDMSAILLLEIQQSIEKYNRKFTKLTA